MSVGENSKAIIKYTVEKFIAENSEEIKTKNLKPYETVESTPKAIELDVLLNEGIQNLINLICGLGTPTPWDNAHARIGVGDNGTAPDPNQTGLLGTNQLYKGMNTGYPVFVSPNKVQWQADFIAGEAEWAWNEETVDNGAAAGINLCRQNTALGTKPAGQTWRLTAEITFS